MKQMGKKAFALLVMLSFVHGAGLQNVRAETDSRFYGDYFGTYTETYVHRVRMWFFVWHTISERRETVTCEIAAHADYHETSDGQGLVSGSGRVEGPDGPLDFAFTGFVVGHGRLEGIGKAADIDQVMGRATLSRDGRELTLRAMDRTIVLRKDARGNRAPSVRITAPAVGARIPYGDLVFLRGEAADPEDGAVDPERMVWSSDRDGRLGKGPRITAVDLSSGLHRIVLAATDRGGLTAEAQIPVTVHSEPPNLPRIFHPTAGLTYSDEQTIVFRGHASDGEEGVLTGDALTWRSNRSGVIGHGQLFSRALPAGDHTITLTATDSTELSRASSVDITVVHEDPGTNAPPSVRILELRNWDAVGENDRLVFRATAHDEEDGLLSGSSLAWTDSYATASGRATRTLGRGSSIVVSYMPISGGVDTPHTITVTATDSEGRSTSDEITIYVIPGGLY